MNNPGPRAKFIDALVLVKRYITEEGSEKIRDYFNNNSSIYITQDCFNEALNILKDKCENNKITEDEYIAAKSSMAAWYEIDINKKSEEIDINDPNIIYAAQKIIERHTKIDISSAYLILNVKREPYCGLINNAQTVLVTTDKELAEAAEIEGITPWLILEDAEPE